MFDNWIYFWWKFHLPRLASCGKLCCLRRRSHAVQPVTEVQHLRMMLAVVRKIWVYFRYLLLVPVELVGILIRPWPIFAPTAESPYTSMIGCQPAGNITRSCIRCVVFIFNYGSDFECKYRRIADTWGGLYSGSGCNNLVPRGCAIELQMKLKYNLRKLQARKYIICKSVAEV